MHHRQIAFYFKFTWYVIEQYPLHCICIYFLQQLHQYILEKMSNSLIVWIGMVYKLYFNQGDIKRGSLAVLP